MIINDYAAAVGDEKMAVTGRRPANDKPYNGRFPANDGPESPSASGSNGL
jgi:hypothetical protein